MDGEHTRPWQYKEMINMKTPLNETEIRTMVNGLKSEDPNITTEEVVKKIRGSLVLQGVAWNEDVDRKIRYCIHINPN